MGMLRALGLVSTLSRRPYFILLLTSDPSKDLIKGLQIAAELVGASKQILICQTLEEIRSESLLVTNLPFFLNERAKAKNHQPMWMRSARARVRHDSAVTDSRYSNHPRGSASTPRRVSVLV